jgi:hypothetical protein
MSADIEHLTCRKVVEVPTEHLDGALAAEERALARGDVAAAPRERAAPARALMDPDVHAEQHERPDEDREDRRDDASRRADVAEVVVRRRDERPDDGVGERDHQLRPGRSGSICCIPE